MIDIKTKIHDRFSIEFKVGFVARRKLKQNDFSVGMWIFVPKSLDINGSTYPKANFYRDVKSNIRLITPKFLLRDIASEGATPLENVTAACKAMAADATRTNIAEYEYQIKMFAAIVKSSLRDETDHICAATMESDISYLCDQYCANTKQIISAFRELRKTIYTPNVQQNEMDTWAYCDEFICNVVAQHSFRLIDFLEDKNNGNYTAVISELKKQIRAINSYRDEMGYSSVRESTTHNDRNYLYRHGVLKKFVESQLYLRVPKKRDGVVVEQLYYSIAAGLAMIFATIIAWAFQRTFGNLTWPLFIALIISYMMKDRIKELMRYYFSHRMGSRYFDNKAKISLKDKKIGWMKEGVDFINPSYVNKTIADLRAKFPILPAANRIDDDNIILYRKMVHINREKMEEDSAYMLNGINDIIRLHVNHFVQKMDNPIIPMPVLEPDDSVGKVDCEKDYYLTIVLQYEYDGVIDYKPFRITMTRDGIKNIEELE